jgi:probable HAF family extracellular repeat protein
MHRSLPGCFLLLLLLGGEAVADNRSLGIMTPEGGESVAYDMNAAGQVAAVIADADGVQRGVFFEHGKSIELGSLGGLATEARHINDKGEIIGSASRKDGNWSAFLYDRASGMQVLGTLGGASSHGTALNNAGAAVGFADVASGDWHAFLYQRGEPLQDLGTLGGKISYARGINNRGQVVGTATLPNGYRHAFLYEAGRGMVDLGTLGGRISTATAINDSGMIVGASEMANRRWHAFLYDGRRMTDLGALTGGGDSFASGINSAGHVVGTVLYEDARRSFVWRDNKMMLHGPGKGLYLTNAINNAEQVIGATNDHGLTAAAMLSSTPPFVDPGLNKFIKLIAAVLMLAGAAVVARRRYRGILFGGYGG